MANFDFDVRRWPIASGLRCMFDKFLVHNERKKKEKNIKILSSM